MDTPWRRDFDAARDPYAARNALGILPTPASGNVSNSGTPTSGQYAKWVTATTIQGVAPATVLSDIGAQPVDADLTAIAALTGTNTIYYRSAANTWSPVVVSTGLAFSGGNLTATAGLVLLNTITATAAASVDFTSQLTSTYDEYEVRFSGVYSSSDADLFMCRVGQSGVYTTTANYYYALNVAGSGATNAPTGGTAGGGVILTYPGFVSNLAARPISGKASIASPLSTGANKHIRFNAAHLNSSAVYNAVYGSGAWAGNTSAIDSLRFMMNAGNISGTFKLYGVK